jgi:hypothetical protein
MASAVDRRSGWQSNVPRGPRSGARVRWWLHGCTRLHRARGDPGGLDVGVRRCRHHPHPFAGSAAGPSKKTKGATDGTIPSTTPPATNASGHSGTMRNAGTGARRSRLRRPATLPRAAQPGRALSFTDLRAAITKRTAKTASRLHRVSSNATSASPTITLGPARTTAPYFLRRRRRSIAACR